MYQHMTCVDVSVQIGTIEDPPTVVTSRSVQ